jgi:hypothetical protein
LSTCSLKKVTVKGCGCIMIMIPAVCCVYGLVRYPGRLVGGDLPLSCNWDYNVTVDDSDPSITYVGGWDYGGSPRSFSLCFFYFYRCALRLARARDVDPASLRIAIYYMAALWPYTVNTVMTVDNSRLDRHDGSLQ